MGNNYRYTKIIILGSGKLAYQCALACKKYLDCVEVLEYKVTESTILKKSCEKDGFFYLCCDKLQLREYLAAQTEETLVVSAGNTYLIPKSIIEKRNLMIINWHNALLPRHKGRNAESWSIYAGDKVTGITWHRITENVDAGDVLAQREIPIEPATTALKLFQSQCNLGAQVFEEILESILLGECTFYKQAPCQEEEMHFSHEIPNGGYLDLSWSNDQISCFLRAMDYGALQLLGEIHVKWQGAEYVFRKYKIMQEQQENLDIADRAHNADTEKPCREENISMENGDLIICKEGQKIVLKGLERI